MSKRGIHSAYEVLQILKKEGPASPTGIAVLGILFKNWNEWVLDIRTIRMLLGSKEVSWSSSDLFNMLAKVTDESEWQRLCSKGSDAKLLLETISQHLTVGHKSADILWISDPKDMRCFCLFAKDFFEHKGNSCFDKVVAFLLGDEESVNEKNVRVVTQGVPLNVIVAAFKSVYCFNRERLSAIKGLPDSTEFSVKASALSAINSGGVDGSPDRDKENIFT